MTDETDSPGERISQEDTRAIWPFMLAVGIVGVILAAIIFASLNSSPVPEGDRVVQAVQAFVAAHNVNDPARIKATECPGFDEQHSPLAGQKGRIGLTDTGAVTINGTAATIDVTTKGDGPAVKASWRLVNTQDGWKVCT